MDLVSLAMVTLTATTVLAAGIFAGGMIACWEQSRNKGLTGEADQEDRQRTAA